MIRTVYIIEGLDHHGRWTSIDAVGGGSEFSSRLEAEGAIEDRICYYSERRNGMRVREIPDYHSAQQERQP